MLECANIDSKINSKEWAASFAPLNNFVHKFSSQFKHWASSLKSQTFFFDNVIKFHIHGEDSQEMQSRTQPGFVSRTNQTS